MGGGGEIKRESFISGCLACLEAGQRGEGAPPLGFPRRPASLSLSSKTAAYPWSPVLAGPGCGQGPCAATCPGSGRARLPRRNSSFHGRKPTDTVAAAVNGAVAPSRVGAGGFGEGARPGIGVAAKRGLKLLPVPAAPGKAGAGGGDIGGHKRRQCRGAVCPPGAQRPWLGCVHSIPAVAREGWGGGGACSCVCVASAGTGGSRVRDGDEPQGRGTGERSSFVSAS